MRFSRFLAAAAATPPALVFQVSYANGLGVIRDLGVSQVELKRGARVDGVLSLKDPVPGIKNVGRVALQIVRRRPSTRMEI